MYDDSLNDVVLLTDNPVWHNSQTFTLVFLIFPFLLMLPTCCAMRSTYAVKCFAVDCQDDPDLATDFDIKSIPVTILFKDGEEVNRLSGKLSKDQLKDLVNN
jgi:thiol-disulfide isomerase/thioredoxin